MLKAVLFDLDATLLPMDQDAFIRCYFKYLCEKFVPMGYDKDLLVNGMWSAINAMFNNNGTSLNEKVFWQELSKQCGERVFNDKTIFDEFYKNDFPKIKDEVCGVDPQAKEIVRWLKGQGIITVLATNPVYPKVATHQRLNWAGLTTQDFAHITTYENSSYCKPNIQYYREILSVINCEPENALMVGNDVQEDMVVQQIGMKVFLADAFIIDKNNTDISKYPHGNFGELKKYIENIL
jgi:FMN phosphatase YigB (HAD superfamily)